VLIYLLVKLWFIIIIIIIIISIIIQINLSLIQVTRKWCRENGKWLVVYFKKSRWYHLKKKTNATRGCRLLKLFGSSKWLLVYFKKKKTNKHNLWPKLLELFGSINRRNSISSLFISLLFKFYLIQSFSFIYLFIYFTFHYFLFIF